MGYIYIVEFSYRGRRKYSQFFYRQGNVVKRQDIQDDLEKVYPGAILLSFSRSEQNPALPLIVMKEDLRDWFGKGKKGGAGGGGWDRYNTKGERVGKCAREPGEPKPKCLSKEKAAKMSKSEIGSAVKRKRKADPVADRKGKGGKPKMVSNNIGEEYIEEKNVPTNPALWSKMKSRAKAKFDVYPSAYANGWAAKEYKKAGGGWKSSTSESFSEQVLAEKKGPCWKGYKQVGMKKKGGKQVPNCVPEEKKSFKDFTEGAAWTKKSGKNSEGGLNEKGRKSYERENPGSDLKAPSKKVGNPRRKSFCARMSGMKKKLTSSKTANDPDSRINKSLRAWNC
ncbi:hypothetical protein SBM3_00185 [Synechococcus phage S-BM3]|nr:hypothetical protein SBM3_00185 [Synechococcus phage S-BM3]